MKQYTAASNNLTGSISAENAQAFQIASGVNLRSAVIGETGIVSPALDKVRLVTTITLYHLVNVAIQIWLSDGLSSFGLQDTYTAAAQGIPLKYEIRWGTSCAPTDVVTAAGGSAQILIPGVYNGVPAGMSGDMSISGAPSADGALSAYVSITPSTNTAKLYTVSSQLIIFGEE